MGDYLLPLSLFAAEGESGFVKFAVFVFIALVGMVMIGLGVYAIKTKRAIVRRRDKWLLRLFGAEEPTGKVATYIGICQCAAGGIALLVAVTGPFWAGTLKEDNRPPHRPEPGARVERNRPRPPGRPERPSPPPRSSTPGKPKEPEDKPLPPLGSPEAPLPAIEWSDEHIGRSAEAGRRRDQRLDDRTEAGAVLVGLRCAYNKERFQGTVIAIQPIYQRAGRYLPGQRLGGTGGTEVEALAKPGYAVGGLRIKHGSLIHQVQPIFHRVSGNQLDPNDSYEGPPLGGDAGKPVEISSDGHPIVGLAGSHDSGVYLRSLQLIHPDPPKEIGSPEVALPTFAYAAGAVTKVTVTGDESGTTFSDLAPQRGLLVGARFFQGQSWGGALQAIAPIYQLGDRYVEGQRHGQPGGDEIVLLAKPGYAVGTVRARAGLVLNAVQLVFMRVGRNGLDPADSYEADWVGAEGGSPGETGGDGKLVVGMHGCYKKDLVSIGVMLAEVPGTAATPPSNAEPAADPAQPARPPAAGEEPMRTWASADGKFKTEARMVSFRNGMVHLELADGRKIQVQINKLGPADRAYVAQRLRR